MEQVTAELENAVSNVPANGHAEITLDQTNNSSEIYSLATGDVESAFSQTIPTDGHADVTLDQTNNADAIYSECAGQVQSTFSQGFSASADVAVTLNWHITNPSASISTSSSGSSVSATIAGHANGGEVGLSGPELSWVGEEGLSRKEQLSIMLEENMQRSDLTIYEQAQGFQLMLDLGDTEEQIAEKTGFSKTTIRRRLNIAKLNQDELKKKEQDENFQLTLKDLYELEKVKDIKTRDKILREATSSRDLVSRAQAAAAEAKRNENAKKLKEMLKKKGIKAAPKSAENEIWSGKWNTIKEYELDKDVPEQIKLPKTEEEKFFLVYYRSLRIITKIPKGKKELSPWEKEQKEKDQAKRKIKAILKESSARRKEFLENIISGKISPVKDESEVKEKIWEAMMALGSYIYASTVRDFYLKKSYYESSPEEKKAADESAGKLSSLHQMMIILHNSMKICNEPYDYNLVFNKNKGDALLKGYEVFEPYGWYFEDEKERQVLDGTSELYRKEKKE